jgi:hypothetical protein
MWRISCKRLTLQQILIMASMNVLEVTSCSRVAESLAFSSVTSSKRLMEKNAFSPVI